MGYKVGQFHLCASNLPYHWYRYSAGVGACRNACIVMEQPELRAHAGISCFLGAGTSVGAGWLFWHLGNWEKLASGIWVYLAYLVALEILGRSPVSSTSWCHLAVLGSYLALSSSDLAAI